MKRLLALLLPALLLSACHTMRFDLAPQPEARVVHEHNSYFFWGLGPVVVNDVSQRCPNGVVAIKEQETAVDWLAQLATLGIWSLRSSWYYCAPDAPNAPEGGNS